MTDLSSSNYNKKKEEAFNVLEVGWATYLVFVTVVFWLEPSWIPETTELVWDEERASYLEQPSWFGALSAVYTLGWPIGCGKIIRKYVGPLH